MTKIRCSFCKKDFPENEIFGFFPEDDSFLCKHCLEKTDEEKNPARKKNNKK